MQFEHVAAAVEGVPFMSREEGRIVYDHVRSTKPEVVLELGAAHGVSSAYIAAALEENGGGTVTTVESSAVTFEDPTAEELLDRIGLARFATVDRRFSTYTWFLKEQIQARSDAAGNCDPLYDFCYLDGAKNWTTDGLAVLLVEKLLRPGGWLLMDDLDWTYSPVDDETVGVTEVAPMSPAERSEPHLRAVFELIVKQHPSFTELRIQDGWWGWARKAPGEPRVLTLETKRSLRSFAVAGMRWAKRRATTRG
jgi:predicted O-methyltransferase YrrM